jgi:hypothetical protein
MLLHSQLLKMNMTIEIDFTLEPEKGKSFFGMVLE